jgi:DNA protecting protein DprA
MILNELLTAMTHVASQLTGIWFPAPIAGGEAGRMDPVSAAVEQYRDGGLCRVGQQSWIELLEVELSGFKPRLPWLEKLLRARRISLAVLADSAVRHFNGVTSASGTMISIHSPFYPPLLRQVARPPLYLTALGNVGLLRGSCVAVIGSRKASYEALRASVDVGMSLSKSPWTVVSGGAIGCDIAVHEGMLASGQDDVSAIIVFAGGLHARFPRCNDRAFSEVLARGGLLVSERLWFQDVLPRDFPARNRIVSGMCAVTSVMSAASRSGSLITAHEALEQGRDVYVFDIPGDDARMDGSRQLISDGACPFFTPEEFMDYLSQGYPVVPDSNLGFMDITCQAASYLGTFDAEQILN